jgi:hypothetical protein
MTPLEEPFDCVVGLRGILAGNAAISVDKFLERKHADMEMKRDFICPYCGYEWHKYVNGGLVFGCWPNCPKCGTTAEER